MSIESLVSFVFVLIIVAAMALAHYERIEWYKARAVFTIPLMLWTVAWVVMSQGAELVQAGEIVAVGATILALLLLILTLLTMKKRPAKEQETALAKLPQTVELHVDESRPAVAVTRVPTYAELLEGATVISFDNEVNSYTAGNFAEACEKAAASDKERVLVKLNSAGGDVAACVNMHEQLRLLAQVKIVNVLVIGNCQSCAVWLITAIAPEHRWGTQYSQFMLHPATLTSNNPRLSAEGRNVVERQNQEWTIKATARGSRIRQSDLEEMVRANGLDVRFGAAEAIEFGLIAGSL